MNEAAEVYLWGKRIGLVSRVESEPTVTFVYDDAFIGFGVEPAPVMMPVARRGYSFAQLPERTFHGLPGMLADSVPDKFGNAVIDAWLRKEGRLPGSMTPIERLCYTGSRGMGALEYRPAIMRESGVAERLEVEALAKLADAVLKGRKEAKGEFDGMASILRVGTSAGGARAKALIGWNEQSGEVRSGQVRLDPGFGYWLIKFDGISGNGDKEGDDEWDYGRVEYAYYLMAKAAGLKMSECRLWEGRHFMTRRFDRTENGDKLHLQTLGAMAHFDFNDPRGYSYEQAFRITRQVVHDVRAESQLFRQMVFNVLAWNCDDHVKNISYLMNRNGEWSLAPTYDVTFAYKPQGMWTSSHQMSVNGKNRMVEAEDMLAAGKVAGLKAAEMHAIIDEVREAVGRWREFAESVGVKVEFTQSIDRVLSKMAKVQFQ